MITNDNKLWVFENFQVDLNLPKHKQKEGDAKLTKLAASDLASFGDVSSAVVPFNEGWVVENNGIMIPKNTDTLFGFLKRKIWNFLMEGNFKTTDKKDKNPKNAKSIVEFFASVKNSAQELDIVVDRAKDFEKTIEYASKCGQTALVEKLNANLDIIRSETQLLAMGKVTVITEEQLVQFYKESERGLRLDWIKNFTRIIPSEVMEVKLRADECLVFDNYVVLHYDPQAKSYAQTQKEKEAEEARKKDPILFGVIKGSRKLYFVGDWIDEVCDLTLEDLVNKLGEEAVNVNNLSVKKYL